MTAAVVDELKPRGAGPRTCAGGVRVWLTDGGIMYVKLPENGEVSVVHAAAAAQVVRDFSGGKPYSLLLDLTGVKSVSRRAREIYGQPQATTAHALLGDGPVDRVLAHYLLASSPAGLPVKFFESEPEARQWLQTFPHES